GLAGPVKAGVAAGVVAVGVAAVALALMNDSHPAGEVARPSSSPPVVRSQPPASTPSKKKEKKEEEKEEEPGPKAPAVVPAAAPPPARTASPTPGRSPGPAPSPRPAPPRTPAPGPPPRPTPTSSPTPTPTPPPAPVVYEWSDLRYDITGDGSRPEMRLAGSSWVWRRYGLSVADKRYTRGVTVHGDSSVTVDLNRECAAYDAMAGVDDLTLGLGGVRFSVYADGTRLWRSGVVRGGDPAVPVHVNLTGHRAVRLVVDPGRGALDSTALADWADSRFTCR
ncbi:NPCBM/NEW2 domain-containing protein, partial [Streptomyces sp. NPDC058964]|uniref:NPCBM/NEW2 domain-containing protein n=1 Tax=Streptomyces sp. NPDC058964 TaxID=3346681 RepID=UPI00367E968C